MKFLKIVLLPMIIMGLIFSLASAAGDTKKGRAMFNDPKFAGGTKSCSSCHPNGKGLEKAGEMGRKEWKNPAGTFTSLEDTINVCIILANKGKAIHPKSDEMKDLVTYIISLHKGKKHAPGY